MPTSTPTIAQLERALEIAQQIQKLEAELAAVMGGGVAESTPVKRGPGRPPKIASPVSSSGTSKRGRKPFSAETKAKMAAAQQARWAKLRGPSAGVVSPLDLLESAPRPKKKRTVSPEVKARLAAAMKARWAEAKKKGLPGPNARK